LLEAVFINNMVY